MTRVRCTVSLFAAHPAIHCPFCAEHCGAAHRYTTATSGLRPAEGRRLSWPEHTIGLGQQLAQGCLQMTRMRIEPAT